MKAKDNFMEMAAILKFKMAIFFKVKMLFFNISGVLTTSKLVWNIFRIRNGK